MSKELISPEGLQIAEAYLANGQSTAATAAKLGLTREVVSNFLQKREVRNYVDRMYYETGFRNREKLGSIMDAVITKKLEEMDETELGSSKDIAELIKLQHDMKMKEMEMAIKMAEIKAPTTQNNVQVLAGGSGYNQLLERILGINDGSK